MEDRHRPRKLVRDRRGTRVLSALRRLLPLLLVNDLLLSGAADYAPDDKLTVDLPHPDALIAPMSRRADISGRPGASPARRTVSASARQRPARWRDPLIPDIHGEPGS